MHGQTHTTCVICNQTLAIGSKVWFWDSNNGNIKTAGILAGYDTCKRAAKVRHKGEISVVFRIETR